MSLINMQDGIIKSSLVQQLQSKSAQNARTVESTHVPFNQEEARKADEVVSETAKMDNETIRDDSENPQEQKQKQRRRRSKEEPEDEDTPSNNYDDGYHGLIDITI